MGCYSNKSPTNALPDSFDSNVSSVSGPDAIYDYCKAKAEQLGYNLFGADDKNCWSGDDAENTYNKYGISKQCVFSEKGTGHANGQDMHGSVFVYELEWGEFTFSVVKRAEPSPNCSIFYSSFS